MNWLSQRGWISSFLRSWLSHEAVAQANHEPAIKPEGSQSNNLKDGGRNVIRSPHPLQRAYAFFALTQLQRLTQQSRAPSFFQL